MATTNIPEIILFWYDISVYSRRMDYYLTLRGLPYKRCTQPPNMPRPDLQRIGVNYRRIPIVAIGRDIYCDTRLIIEKLEHLFPEGALGSKNPFEQGLEKVFESWIVEAGPFWRVAGCLPLSSPAVMDPVWMQDRAEGTGGRFTHEMLEKGQPECVAHLRMYYSIAETMLADGRRYIFDTDKPTLGDIHAIWSFDWGIHLAMHADYENVDDRFINEQAFPRVFAWVARFREAYRVAEETQGDRRTMISSDEAVGHILGSEFFEKEGDVIGLDPIGLHKGQKVTVCPSDFGRMHSDSGVLVSLTIKEVVIENSSPGKGCRLHFPRNNFTITADQTEQSKI